MSMTGQYVHSEGGHDSLVHEYGYGLGPPTGILVLHHLRGAASIQFPESRDDYRHQLFWSHDGVLAVRRGGATAHLGPDRGFWVRRGTSVEVVTCGESSVHVVCLRQPPPRLAGVPAATLALSQDVRDTILTLCREETSEEDGALARDRLFTQLDDPLPLDASGGGNGLARQVAAALLADPGDPTELTEWARRLHTTSKTLQRDFDREFGTSWSTWRTRTKLQASTALLGRFPVGEVAHRVGYASASAYVQAFRLAYGETPGTWAARLTAG